MIIRIQSVLIMLCVGADTVRAQPVLVGCTAYLTSNPQPSQLVDIDPTTGVASNPRNIGITVMGGIATQPSTGNLFGLTTFASTPASSLVRINVMTGASTLVGPTGLPNIVEGDLAFNPINGLLYGLQDFGVTFDQRNLFQINPITGTSVVVGSLGSQGDFSAMAFDAVGRLFVIDTLAGNNRLLRVDPVTASIISAIPISGNLGGAAAMTFDPLTGVALVANGDQQGIGTLFNLDTNSGFLVPIGQTVSGGLAGLAFVSVPESNSLILSLVPFLAFVFQRQGSRVFFRD